MRQREREGCMRMFLTLIAVVLTFCIWFLSNALI